MPEEQLNNTFAVKCPHCGAKKTRSPAIFLPYIDNEVKVFCGQCGKIYIIKIQMVRPFGDAEEPIHVEIGKLKKEIMRRCRHIGKRDIDGAIWCKFDDNICDIDNCKIWLMFLKKND